MRELVHTAYRFQAVRPSGIRCGDSYQLTQQPNDVFVDAVTLAFHIGGVHEKLAARTFQAVDKIGIDHCICYSLPTIGGDSVEAVLAFAAAQVNH